MPNFSLPYPVSIDFDIQELIQKPMYNKLLGLWSLDDTQYNCFGRAYRNKTDDGYIPEFYNPDVNNTNSDYIGSNGVNAGGLFFEDSIAAVSFFGLLDPIKSSHSQPGATDTAKVELLFFVNLSKITAGGIPLNKQLGQRLDEICLNDVWNWLRRRGGSTVECIERYRDVDKVLERYSGSLKRDTLMKDMQPYFCFKIIFELKYNPLLNTMPIPLPS